MPRNSDNNTIMVTQSTSLWTCNSHLDSNISLIQQNNINGRTNYTIHLFLESDPAALQALDYFRIHIIGYGTEVKLVYKFVSIIDHFMNCVYKYECVNYHILCTLLQQTCENHSPCNSRPQFDNMFQSLLPQYETPTTRKTSKQLKWSSIVQHVL